MKQHYFKTSHFTSIPPYVVQHPNHNPHPQVTSPQLFFLVSLLYAMLTRSTFRRVIQTDETSQLSGHRLILKHYKASHPHFRSP